MIPDYVSLHPGYSLNREHVFGTALHGRSIAFIATISVMNLATVLILVSNIFERTLGRSQVHTP